MLLFWENIKKNWNKRRTKSNSNYAFLQPPFLLPLNTHIHSHFIHPNHVKFSCWEFFLNYFSIYMEIILNCCKMTPFHVSMLIKFDWIDSRDLDEIRPVSVSRRRYTHKLFVVIWPFMPWLSTSHRADWFALCSTMRYC